MTSRTPEQVVDRAMALLLAHDMPGFAGLWTPDGTMEFPFAPPGRPRRLAGRAAVAEYLADYTDHIDLRAIPERTLHHTTDPEVVVVEFTAEGVVVATGGPYRLPYIAVIRVRDGEIVSYRDYWSMAAAGDAEDGVSAFGTAS